MAKGNSGKTKGQKREDLERKRDERARRRSMKKEREIKEYLQTDENFVSFKNQLEASGLKIKDILGGGNCLFRALGDQLNGDHTAHAYHRRNTIHYMKEHREDFEPFMEDGVTFEKHLKELSKLGTYGGNDSIVAFARNNGLDIVIHQLNNPRWVIRGSEYSKTPELIELHLAYHNGEHYSSVRRLTDPGDGPAWQFNKKQKNDKTLNETSLKTDTKSKKRKDQKKKDKSFEQGASSSSSAENGQPLEQIVMRATGCKDVKLVTETLEENFFDVDASIGYILQLMAVIEEQDCLLSRDTLSHSHISSVDVAEKENSFTSEEIVIKDKNSSTSENYNEKTLGNHKDIADKTDSSTTCRNNSMCDENSEEKNSINTVALNEFVANLRDGLTETELDKEKSKNKMIKQGARPKETTKKNSTKVTPHLSNRQRKEQAKQEKKKRREERRKDDQEDKSRNNSDLDSNLDSLVGDLGAVRI